MECYSNSHLHIPTITALQNSDRRVTNQVKNKALFCSICIVLITMVWLLHMETNAQDRVFVSQSTIGIGTIVDTGWYAENTPTTLTQDGTFRLYSEQLDLLQTIQIGDDNFRPFAFEANADVSKIAFLGTTNNGNEIQIWSASETSSTLLSKIIIDQTSRGYFASTKVISWHPTLPERLVVFNSFTFDIELWDVSGTLPVLTARWDHPTAVDVLKWSPDGIHLATADSDNLVRVWRVDDQSIQAELECDRTQSFDWNADGTLIACSRGDILSIIDSSTGTLIRTFPQASGFIDSISWVGQRLAVSTFDYQTFIFNTTSDQLLSSFNNRTITRAESTTQLHWNITATKLLSNEADAVRVLDSSGITQAEESNYIARSQTFRWSGDGNAIATAHIAARGGLIRIWDAQSGTLLAEFITEGGISTFDWSPDGNYFAIADYVTNSVTIKSYPAWETIASISAISGPVSWSPNS